MVIHLSHVHMLQWFPCYTLSATRFLSLHPYLLRDIYIYTFGGLSSCVSEENHVLIITWVVLLDYIREIFGISLHFLRSCGRGERVDRFYERSY